MAAIAFERVCKRYDDGTLAVDELDLEVPDGSFTVLVGPSGCGKSTVLRMLAGLEEVSSGSVRIGDDVVNELAPKDRDIAMVFQSYALYPHMSVADNMGFALKMRSVAREQIRRRVAQTADMLGIGELLDKRPRTLSGGQRQRVALGRSIVRAPRAFLMDEPLSNLDAKLRVEMRGYLQTLHRDLGITTLYVTHDQTEAMTMGDLVAVLRRGRLEQVAPPQTLYDRPANVFVAGFMGSPPMNTMRGRLEDGDSGMELVLGSHRLAVAPALYGAWPALRTHVGGEVVVGVRPEALEVCDRHADPGRVLELPVMLTEALGSDVLVHADLDAPPVLTGDAAQAAQELESAAAVDSARTRLTARVPPSTAVTAGERVRLLVEPAALQFFDPVTQRSLREEQV
jgi:multiple sugar transport system ATP-binding protein